MSITFRIILDGSYLGCVIVKAIRRTIRNIKVDKVEDYKVEIFVRTISMFVMPVEKVIILLLSSTFFYFLLLFTTFFYFLYSSVLNLFCKHWQNFNTKNEN